MVSVADFLDRSPRSASTVDGNVSIYAVLKMLVDSKRGALVVLDRSGAAAGLIVEYEIIRALLSSGNELSGLDAKAIMRSDFLTCLPTESDSTVLSRMIENKTGHLVVVEGGTYLGLVALADAVRSRLETVIKLKEALGREQLTQERISVLERHLNGLRQNSLVATDSMGSKWKTDTVGDDSATDVVKLDWLAASIILFVSNRCINEQKVTPTNVVEFGSRFEASHKVRIRLKYLIFSGFLEKRRSRTDRRKSFLVVLPRAMRFIDGLSTGTMIPEVTREI